jgi:hypothetical protein
MTTEVIANDLEIGAEVFTTDGKRLGKVKKVVGERFKVDIPWKADCWLSFSAIANCTPTRVSTIFPRRKLNEYKL